ncbi:ChbG/HpnK family deacetylase [Nitrospirillum sp. BR 11163]|uniref:ChbG/HpnK family deacetylase n=1 Tax=Nitrospirillum sp. BR 11163 TaxID=3104323 RepID=UPI002AFF0220|nr:ChbG/HpnK family deacetylase [Nitrospirillum sp. BR 11163]MEA1677227.1 ChbG/HpnK family deacetylase [Nitrospirillum sp. BR 11163]
MTATIVLNADDYGLSPGVSQGILALIRQGRLSGTSCMTATPYWPDHAPWLADVADRADIGLHLTLTDQEAAGPCPALAPGGRFGGVGDLMIRSLTGQLSGASVQADLKAEIERQLDLFEAHAGRPPSHVDGHQHVHLLPGVRGLVLDAVARRYPRGSVYVRDCAEPMAAVLARGVDSVKALIIASLARGLRTAAARRGIPTNRGFRGVYDFGPDRDFPALMARFLEPARDRVLIMVHPALPDEVLAGLDPVVASRQVEQAYLSGEAFAQLLDRMGVRLGRLQG